MRRLTRAEPDERYAQWVRRFIMFYGQRHPRELGLAEVGRFLEHVAQSEKEPLRSIEQAREALEFLYQTLLQRNLETVPLPTNISFGHGPCSNESCEKRWSRCAPCDVDPREG